MYQGSSLYVFTIPIIAYIIWRCARERESFVHLLMWIAFSVYVTELLSRTFFPLPVDAAYIALERANAYGSHNLIPFRTIAAMLAHPVPGVAFMQVFGNLVLFLPFGYFLPLLFSRFSGFRRAMTTLLALVLTVEIGQLLLSVLVYGYTYKSFDVDDILLNLTGALAGYWIYRMLSPRTRSSLSTQSVVDSESHP